jgi:hypothetical protein
VLKVAWPLLFSGLVPKVVVVPSKRSEKVTVPLGPPAPDDVAVTLAVKVNDWPKTEDVGDTLSAVVVAA